MQGMILYASILLSIATLTCVFYPGVHIIPYVSKTACSSTNNLSFGSEQWAGPGPWACQRKARGARM